MTRARNSANLASHGNLFVDITNDRTGIGSVVPDQNLHVAGTAGFHADVTFTGDLYNTTWDRSANSLKFVDNARLRIGSSDDFQIYHDGSFSRIQNTSGDILIKNSASGRYLYLQSDIIMMQPPGGGDVIFDGRKDGFVRLYHDGSQKFETTAYGTNTTGTAVNDGLVVAGVATVTTMNVTGVLTYEDVTSVDSVGIVTARQGIHIDDSIVHISDPNTKIRFPANDTISFETSGSERIRIDSNGILKLGTSLTDTHVNNAPSEVKFFLNSGRGPYGGLNTNAIIFDNQTAAVNAGGTLTLAGFTGSTAIAKAAIRGGNEGSSSTNNGYFAVFTRPTSGSLAERFRIASDGAATFSGNLTVSGDLSVTGSTTQNNSVSTAQKTITLASGAANNAAADGAGIVVDAGSDTDKTIKWLDSTDRWTFTGGDVSANAFYGDGSNLTGLNVAINTLTNASNNRVLTSSGGSTVNAESALLFNGYELNFNVSGSQIILRGAGVTKHELLAHSSNNDLTFVNNRDGGNVTSNIVFKGSGAGGATVSEKMRITTYGVGINHDTTGASNNAALTIKNRTSSTATRFNLVNSGSSSVESTQIYSQNNDLVFVAGANDRLRIKSGGTVAIPSQGSSNANPRLIFESSADSNDFTFSQYEDSNGVYTLIGQNIQLSSNGNTNALDSGHRSSGIFFDGRNHGYLSFLTADAGNSPAERMQIARDGTVTLKNNSGMMIDLQSSATIGSVWMEFSDTDGTRKGYIGYGSGSNDTMYIVQSKPYNMEFYSNGSTRFLIQSNGIKVVQNGRLNINSTFIDFSGSISTPSTAAAIYRPADNTLAFSTANNERVRITSSNVIVTSNIGHMLLGTDTSRTINSHAPRLQVTGTNYSHSTVSVINNEASANGAYLFLGKQRSGAVGGSSAVQEHDIIGQIRFNAGDGTDMENSVGYLEMKADANAQSNNTPGYFQLYTTLQNGSGDLKMRVHQNSNHSRLFSMGTGGSHLNNATSPDRTSMKVGASIHIDSTFGHNANSGMYYNCYSGGNDLFYRGTNNPSGGDWRAAAQTMRFGSHYFYGDPSNNTYSAQAQISTMQLNMAISREGYVTKPKHPCFQATRDGMSHIQMSSNANADVVFASVDFDNSSSYNNSNGRFTAPVAGKYYFGIQFYTGFSVTAVRVMHAVWKINGSNSHTADLFGGISNHGGTHYHPTTVAHVMLNLASGDYVTFNLGSFSSTGSGNTYLYGTKGSRFFGHLIA